MWNLWGKLTLCRHPTMCNFYKQRKYEQILIGNQSLSQILGKYWASVIFDPMCQRVPTIFRRYSRVTSTLLRPTWKRYVTSHRRWFNLPWGALPDDHLTQVKKAIDDMVAQLLKECIFPQSGLLRRVSTPCLKAKAREPASKVSFQFVS